MVVHAEGARFAVHFWEADDAICPVLEFLTALELGGQREHEDWGTLLSRLQYFTDHGPPPGIERCRFFKGEDVFEIKARGGARLMCFYHPAERAVVVCSHGFRKPPSNRGYRREIERAQAARERCRVEKTR